MLKERLISLTAVLLIAITSHAQDGPVDIETTLRPNHSVEFHYTKKWKGTYTLEVRFLLLQNSKYQTRYIVANKDKGKMLALFPEDLDYQITYNVNYEYTPGWINPPVNKSFPYVLPFANGTEVSLEELPFPGADDPALKQPENWIKYKFNTSAQHVYACRKGTVVLVDQRHTTDETTTGINIVTVEHPDGSRAVYEGFAQNAIICNPGDVVYPGALLGALPQNGYLGLHIFYLSDKHITDPSMKTVLNAGRMKVCVKPLFITAEGTQFLNIGEPYYAKITEQHIMEEMNPKEKRQYRKMR